MSKFKTRLRYYMIGFGLGLVFMFMIFGNRACSWLPENRVKNMIAEKQLIVGDSVWDLMQCQGVDSEDIYRFLNEDGDVDFSDSKTRSYPKEYLFKGDKNNEDLSITFALYDEYSEVIDFDFSQKNCATDKSNTDKMPVPLPASQVRKIIEAKEMRIKEKAQCEMKCYGLTEKQVLAFHTGADVVMAETNPHADPNGYYTMRGKIAGKVYSVTYIDGENRTRISRIKGSTECDCNVED
ncbi:MAG: DUF4258 domain-containing protein [Crocinitomicaceae bacterium]|nr:DUF4258 domain-containing protein [Crocinitomicaceae bacterium]